MYAQVVVLTYQSPDIDSYTYEIPKKFEGLIKPGQIVQVPFGKRNPVGLVLSTMPEVRNSKFEIRNLKSITNIILNRPLLFPYQIKLLKWLSFYYHAPMVNCLGAMLPALPVKLSNYSSSESGVSRRNREVLNGGKFSTSSNNMQKVINQILVLVPTINRIPEVMAKFPQAKNYAIYHNELKMSERLAVWQKLLSGQTDFIFGSRSAVFTPCPNLAKIIIFDEHDGVYKDERSPYFDTLTVAEKTSELVNARLQIIDSAPKIATYFSHKNEIKIPKYHIRTSIVSMIDERKKGNKTSLSDLLSTLLVRTHQQKGSSLLFLNKKAGSGQIYCKSCQYQEFLPQQPKVCPNCQSPDFYFNSLNINTLAQTVKKILPASHINLIAEGYGDTRHEIRDTTIDIATATVFYRPNPKKYDLAVYIAPDTILNLPEFTAEEKMFTQIVDLKKLMRVNGRLILQTYNPENSSIKNAAIDNYPAYFKAQLTQRKALSFPPFSLLIKLTIKGKNQKAIEEKAEKLIEEINQYLVSSIQYPVSILGPFQPVFRTKTPSYNIILKSKFDPYSLKAREEAIKNLSPYFEKVSRDWQITVEPSNIN